jgi:UDP-2-acetamido-3-amino-2,3-dideoxy-glucuronate N-acetyltransferase
MNTISIALFGCGGWGKNLARDLHSLGVLSIIVDQTDAAKAMAAELGVAYLESPDLAFKNAGIDAVVIATPAETHASLGIAALLAGKHVYVEKPIALSSEDAKDLASTAVRCGLTLMVGHLLQYHPIYKALSELIKARRLGDVRHIISSRLNLGMVRNEENVMWSFSPHDVSMVLGLASTQAMRVRAVGSSFLQSGIDDLITIHIAFGDGLISEIRSSWCHPEKVQKLIVIGTAAMAVFDDTAAWDDKLKITDYAVDRSAPRPRAIRGLVQTIAVPSGEPLKLEMQHFIDCVISGTSPVTDAREAIAVLSILQAAQKSLDGQGEWFNV